MQSVIITADAVYVIWGASMVINPHMITCTALAIIMAQRTQHKNLNLKWITKLSSHFLIMYVHEAASSSQQIIMEQKLCFWSACGPH